MDEVLIARHLSVASEAFLQVVLILSRILAVAAGIALAATAAGILRLCLDESRTGRTLLKPWDGSRARARRQPRRVWRVTFRRSF